jgi:tRNA A37 threonylcarbamoyladenosine biosynthesis protein TsaE
VRIYTGDPSLAHVDLYRLGDPTELEGLGLDELLEDAVVVVEWGDRLNAEDAVKVEFEALSPTRRRLRLEGGGGRWSWS